MNKQLMNRIHNSTNPCQGEFKKVLCVCSAGLLRSPTAAWVLSNPPFNFNTRAAGATDAFALVQVDDVLLSWADEIVCMEQDHVDLIKAKFASGIKIKEKPIICLHIEDSYYYRQEELKWLIAEKYKAHCDISKVER